MVYFRRRWLITYFLQKVSRALPLWTLEPKRQEEFEHAFSGPLIHNLPVREQYDVIKKVICLGCRLQQGDEGCATEDVDSLPK